MPQPAHVSFLLGAGFSKPAGYPLASDINGRFSQLKADDFEIGRASNAFWLKRRSSSIDPHVQAGLPGSHFHRPAIEWEVREKIFAQDVLEYYVSRVGQSCFHYEEFYDWYHGVGEPKINLKPANAVAKTIADRLGFSRAMDPLGAFDRTFNQLLAEMLEQPEQGSDPKERVIQSSSHDRFLNLATQLSSRFDKLHFHSLNHDLYFEQLFTDLPCIKALSDGFDGVDSPYYGKLRQCGGLDQDIRIERFSSKYETSCCLYKIHGSINHYQVGADTLKLSGGVNPNDPEFIYEHQDEARGRYCRYLIGPLWYHPRFLSGVKSKKEGCQSTEYFRNVLGRFEDNLKNSPLLIVVGYGFRDSEINRRVEEHFCRKASAKMLVIDRGEPPVPHGCRDRTKLLKAGVEDFNVAEALSFIESACRTAAK